MFTWTEVKKWAESQGYDVTKKKDDSINGSTYYWSKGSEDGSALSVSKFARAVFNHLTENRWVEHQEQYRQKEQINNE